MSVKIELELVSGGRRALEMPPPGPGPTGYFVFMRHASEQSIWPLLNKLLAAAAQPVCRVAPQLHKAGFREPDVSPDSMRNWLLKDGYAFGNLSHVDSLSIDLDQAGRRTFLFVRDPREIVAELHAESPSAPIPEFLKSPPVKIFLRQCQSFVAFHRAREHVTVIRVEDHKFGWRKLALDLIGAFKLKVEGGTLQRIIGITPLISQAEPQSSYRRRFDQASRSALEALLAETLAHFGYPPHESPSPVFLDHLGEFLTAVAGWPSPADVEAPESPKADESPAAARIPEAASAEIERRRPASLVEPDPQLNWRLRANGAREITVLGRRVLTQADAYGCRPVLGQPERGEKTLAVYGCSFTFGLALPYEETFCSNLQAMFPDWRVENYGTGGYGGTQNLIQLRRNSRWSGADYVTFCVLRDHLLRNVADISFRRTLMAGGQGHTGPQRSYPRAALARDGSLEFRSVKHPRWDLDGIDLTDLAPDDRYLCLVSLAVYRHARDLVTGNGGQFFLTFLQENIDPEFRRLIEDAGIPTVDAGIDGREYTCMPDDPHPNARANRHFAEKIGDYLATREPAACRVRSA